MVAVMMKMVMTMKQEEDELFSKAESIKEVSHYIW